MNNLPRKQNTSDDMSLWGRSTLPSTESVLGPFFFSLYVNDLPNYFICTHNLYTSLVKLFFDDTKSNRIVNSLADAIAIQILINTIDDWCDVWQLTN